MNNTNDKLNEAIKKLDRSMISMLEHTVFLAFIVGIAIGAALGYRLAEYMP